MFYEYLAIIPPSSSVSSSIMDMKNDDKTNHYWISAVKSKPHITLSNFIQPISFDEKIINRYNLLASAAAPFPIYLSGFGHFSTHTIFVKLKPNEDLLGLAENVKMFTRKVFRKIPNYPAHIMSEPHLTIAKGISEKDFLQAWPIWEQREYSAQFLANRIQLLRRPLSAVWEKYEMIGDFPFTGSGVLNSQLQIF